MADLFILIFIGLCAGLASGMFGIGGGILIVPALIYLLGYSQRAGHWHQSGRAATAGGGGGGDGVLPRRQCRFPRCRNSGRVRAAGWLAGSTSGQPVASGGNEGGFRCVCHEHRGVYPAGCLALS